MSDFDEIWHDDEVPPSLFTVLIVKNSKFQKSKTAAAAVLKSPKIAISRPRCERFRQNLAQWRSWTFWTVPTVKNNCNFKLQDGGVLHLDKSKSDVSRQTLDRSPRNLAWWRNTTLMTRPTEICNFKNSTWQRPPFWKIEKSPYLGRGFSDFYEIWLVDAFRPFWPFGLLQIENLKFKMAAAVILKNPKITIFRQRFDRSAQHLAWWRILALRTRQAVEILNF